jgi:hypothetical protein
MLLLLTSYGTHLPEKVNILTVLEITFRVFTVQQAVFDSDTVTVMSNKNKFVPNLVQH